MTDYFETTTRIDDRIEGLWRVLGDPNLGQEIKVEEIANALDRIARLQDQRPLASHLSVITDALVPPFGDAA